VSQVNEFLKLLRHTGLVERLQKQQQEGAAASTMYDEPPLQELDDSTLRRVRILDCGCGSSHLTFGTWHFFSNGKCALPCVFVCMVV
jgi:hypothetical protein